MWNWFNCYLSGRHEYGKWCEPGAIFLRCVHCGKRSAGWSLGPPAHAPAPRPSSEPVTPSTAHALPLDRASVR